MAYETLVMKLWLALTLYGMCFCHQLDLFGYNCAVHLAAPYVSLLHYVYTYPPVTSCRYVCVFDMYTYIPPCCIIYKRRLYMYIHTPHMYVSIPAFLYIH